MLVLVCMLIFDEIAWWFIVILVDLV